MGRRRKQTTLLVKRRMDLGMRTGDLAKKAGISNSSVQRIEAGEALSRFVVRNYLLAFDIDLADPKTWPEDLNIEDVDTKVKIVSSSSEKID